MSKRFNIRPGGKLSGVIQVPGDKSMSHRSVIFGALAEGTTHVSGLLEGEDVLATIAAFRAMGVNISGPDDGRLVIHGVGLHGLQEPQHDLDMGNSGTAMRLLSGLLCGQTFSTRLVGDRSLSTRPMRRVVDPLSEMGASITTAEGGTPPMCIEPATSLHAINYQMPMASAQVKSCLLLAGLYAEGKTCVTEPAPTRDHTERMLRGFGYPVSSDGPRVCLEPGFRLVATDMMVPGDISSAAFFIVGATIAATSRIERKKVGINPTRTGILFILNQMGADIKLKNERIIGGEPVADLVVQSAPLHGIHIDEEHVPLAIDEFPAILVAAACASGETILSGAQELRVKESDRIAAMAKGLTDIGIDVTETPDGMRIQGGKIKGGVVDSHGDHRIAMAFAIAALQSDSEIHVDDCDNVATSFPDFQPLADSCGLGISVENT